MVELFKVYTEELHKQFGYRGTWLPGTPVELGAVGVIDQGVFDPESSLTQLGIPFEVLHDSVPDGSLDFRSDNAVRVSYKGAGELNAQFHSVAAADAGAKIEFSRDGAVVLELRGVGIDRISDKATLKRDLMDAVEEVDPDRRWRRDWVVITDLVRADRATILVSGSADAFVELKASGSVAPASLVDVTAGLTLVDSKNVSTRIIAEAGLVPLYRGFRIRRRFWWLYNEVLTADATGPDVEEVFDDADPSEDADEEATDKTHAATPVLRQD